MKGRIDLIHLTINNSLIMYNVYNEHIICFIISVRFVILLINYNVVSTHLEWYIYV